jgi:acyl-CoA synthetase (AMP-forming)/AMP-acid ligase II
MTTEDNNIIHLFLRSEQLNGSTVALRHYENKITYSELLLKIKSRAAYLTSKGIVPGDKVLIFVPMGIDLYINVLALFYIGAAPVFIDEWVSIKRLSLCCTMVDCKAVIANRKLLLLSYLIGKLRAIPIKLLPNGYSNKPSDHHHAVAANDTALITFTTGSTGLPKAANRTHSFLFAQYTALKPCIAKQGKQCYTTLPIVVLVNLALGRTVILPDKTSPSIPSALHNNSIDSIISSPFLLTVLARQEAFSFPHIRHIITGGGAVQPSEAKQIQKKFPDAAVDIIYGSTEAEPISCINIHAVADTSCETFLQKGLPVGKPVSIQLKIIAVKDHSLTETASVELPVGEAGEIIVAGDHVLRQYINNPEATASTKIIEQNTVWHRTGDVGRLDSEGNLYFLGRCNEIIHWQQQIIYPLIISAIIKIQTPVKEAAMLLYKKQLCLILEKGEKMLQPQVATELTKLGITGAHHLYIKKIPKDPRHNTKVDYPALKKLVAKQFK